MQAVRQAREAAAAELSEALAKADADKTAAVTALQAQLTDERAAHDESRASHGRVSRSLTAAETEIARLNAALNDSHDTVSRVRTEVVSLNARIGSLNHGVEQRDGEIAGLRDTVSRLHREVAAAQDETRAREHEMDAATAEWLARLQGLEQRCVASEARANEAEALAHDLARSCERLRKERDDALAAAGRAGDDAAAAAEATKAVAGEWQAKVAACEGRLAGVLEDNEALRRSEAALRDAAGQMEVALKLSGERRDAAEARATTLEVHVAALEAAAREAAAKHKDAETAHEAELSRLQETVTRTRRELADATARSADDRERVTAALTRAQAQVEEEKAANADTIHALNRDLAESRQLVKDGEAQLR